jgi:hypothetical protein
MEKRILIRLVPILVLGAAAVSAQNEQRLQYRVTNDVTQRIPGVVYHFQMAMLSSARPEGLKLPVLQADQPSFAEWKTSMVPSGRIWMALDKSDPQDEYDRLYFDANANGDLTDDPVYQTYRRERGVSFLGPVKAVFPGPDGPITYHLSVELQTLAGHSYCFLGPACWYEGQITVGGVQRQCVLRDRNINGAFNDKSLGLSDSIRIGEQTGLNDGAVGNYVEVDSQLYKLEVARDGAWVRLAEAGEVSYGTVRLAGDISTFIANGENGSFLRQPEKGLFKLPVGEYRVDSWTVAHEDDAGAKWETSGVMPPNRTFTFTVARDDEAKLSLGEPIRATLQVRKNDSVYLFAQRLEGRQGEQITLTRAGARASPPRVRIRSADGSYDRSFPMAYG